MAPWDRETVVWIFIGERKPRMARHGFLSTGEKEASTPRECRLEARGTEAGGGLSRTPCPISSPLGQLLRSNRTESTARSRFHSPVLRLRRSKMTNSALRDR